MMKPYDPDAETVELDSGSSEPKNERTRTWDEESADSSSADGAPSARGGGGPGGGLPEGGTDPSGKRLGLADLHGSWPPYSAEPSSPWARPDPAAAKAATFSSGDLVAGRYRVERFLARGGAGEVYEVHDTALDLRVALKTIRPGKQRDEDPLARLKREIQLARQVTHPNVCRLYELGCHDPADGGGQASISGSQGSEKDGTEGGVHFLTMELLRGRTLFDRIEDEGPFMPEESLGLLRQMAEGLEAAHRSGVVHRDFKSGNVVLMPDPGAPAGMRVVVTDFGLARPVDPELASRLTAQHLIVGTPEYMAPEQVEGQEVSPATDIYALGIVIWEMLTGSLPFEADTALATAFLRLTEPIPSLRQRRPELPAHWDGVIRRCLATDPAERWETPSDVVRALEGSDRRSLWSRGLLVAAVVLLALVGGLAAWFFSGYRGSATAAIVASAEARGPVADRRSVALFGLRNLSDRNEDDWLASALAEMLATEAAAGDRLRVISGDDITRVRLEMDLESRDELTPEKLARAGKMLGCDLVVTGSYLVVPDSAGDQIRLDLQARSVLDGSLVARIGEQGTEDGLLGLVEEAGRALRTHLDLAELTTMEAQAARASQPADATVARLYGEGLEQLRRLDGQAAVDLLQRAVARAPDNPLIRVSLSSAYQLLGYEEKAKTEARLAQQGSDQLSRRDRLWVEAHYFQMVRERRQAVRNYEALWEYFPDELEYGLRLAEAQTWSGDAEAALETLRRLRSGGASDPRIALVEAQAARSLSDYSLQQQKAAEAVQEAEALGASLLVARAKEVEAGALRDLGRHESALDSYRAARQIYLESGLEGPMARLVLSEARVRRHQGHYAEAEDLAVQALEMSTDVGDVDTRRQALNTLAILHRQRGELRKAQRMHQLEVEANREAERRRSIQISLTTLGVVERKLGLLDDAAAHFEEALELAQITDHMRSIAINHNLLGEVEMRRGKLDVARGHFEKALEHNQDIHSPRGRAYYLSALAEVDRASADLESARSRHEEALRIRRAIGEGDNVARSLLDLARLALDGGRVESAIELSTESAENYRELGQLDGLGRALILGARASFAAGIADEAEGKLEEAHRVLRGTESWDPRFWLALAKAEIEGTPAALRRLELLRQEGLKRGFVDLALEGSILLARVRGDRSALEAHRLEAESLGYHLLASQARAAAALPLG